MSDIDYNNDLMKILGIYDLAGIFKTKNYKGTDSCIRVVKHKDGTSTQYINIVSTIGESVCKHCGSVNHHDSKGTRTIYLTHRSFNSMKTILEVTYRRYTCKDCHQYFTDTIPFKVDNFKITIPLLHSILFAFRENTAMSVISRQYGISRNSIYRLFNECIEVPVRFYHLTSTLSIDEFRATTDEGTFAFNITNPITGKTLDIIADRKASYLRNYFLRFPYTERKKVKIIVMDLSGAFKSIMHALFPNAHIIADKFHYVKNVRENMVQARLQACKNMLDKSLAQIIKRNLHLFDQYKKRLNHEKAWFRPRYKRHMTNKQYIEAILDEDACEEFRINYDIYQDFLTIINEPKNDYKTALNEWLDNIFNTKNEYYLTTAKNFRKNWFLPILRSLTYKAKYIRNGETIETCFNNGFIESMNNKVKLVKRNAFGYKYFQNLRKRILLHLGFDYRIIKKEEVTI